MCLVLHNEERGFLISTERRKLLGDHNIHPAVIFEQAFHRIQGSRSQLSDTSMRDP